MTMSRIRMIEKDGLLFTNAPAELRPGSQPD